MKGRSHRFPEPHEDWGDGSWTVDCVCGVNFDDGEEMVNCDECGVWVHTRCSRYVKGDEVFACDKCKGKNNRNDSEEKEVAQLLVELPTKTLGLESSSAANVPARRPFRLWTEIPMEERVHVQGVPGGDPSLFAGSSSIFSRELWKCTGYVPKKFNFKYREFPCWDEDEKCEMNNTCQNGHQADSGPDTLFSLSKEKVLDAPVTSLVGVRGNDDLASNPKPGTKDVKMQECRVKLKRPVSGMEKEKSLISGVSHSNKRRKEESGSSKDRTKKKYKASNSEEEEKKGVSNASYRTIGEHRDRELDSFKDGSQSIRNDNTNDTVSRETINGNLEVDNGGYQASDTTVVACSENVQHSDGYGLEQPDDKAGDQVRIVLKSSETNGTPSPERKDAGNNHVKAESEAKARVDTLDPNLEGSFESTVKPTDGDGTDSTAQDFEAAGSLLTVSQSQTKHSCSGTPQRGEKANQSNSNSLSKHSAQATHPLLAPNSSATLSDEELAILLHQELNSSPRVPRIPRVRQPGSLQLASPAATSLLIKRCSSSGGKDHGSVSRRKSKEAFKDIFRSSRDGDERTLKSSNGRRAQDNGDRGGGSTKGEENEPPRTILSARKQLPPSSTTSTSSGPCSSNEVNDHNVTSPQTSPRIASDGVPVAHRTLPGLINEIMSKGKRMTYEELCNAVLPHWPHLRKHNGERYAYSSHSQAVLDCLRNRHEWARLVDRGPKTNSGRKKRRTEAEDSDDDESSKGLENGSGKNMECQREDFPKGKRKARKRRRLALQGRGLKDTRKNRKAEILHKDGPYSDSSEESMFSEDEEVHGSSRPTNVRGETSASSEENGTR